MKKSSTRQKNLSRPAEAGVQPRPRNREEREGAEAYRKLGSLVRKLREKKGLAEQQLAERCGFSTRRIRRIEKGEATLTFSALKTLSEALETSLVRLLQLAQI